MSTTKLLEAYEAIRQAGVSDFFARVLVETNAERLSGAEDPAKAGGFLAAEAPPEYFEGGKRPAEGETGKPAGGGNVYDRIRAEQAQKNETARAERERRERALSNTWGGR